MASNLSTSFLPALAGDLADIGPKMVQGQVQGMQLARELALLDLQLKNQQLAYQQAQRPQFKPFGYGHFAMVDPRTGMPVQVYEPQQKPSSDAALMGLLANPQTAELVKQYMAMKHPEKPVVIPQGGTMVMPSTGQTTMGQPKTERPVVIPEGGTAIVPSTGKTIEGKPKSSKPISMGEGHELVDPVTGRVIHRTPPKSDKPATLQERKLTADQTALDSQLNKLEQANSESWVGPLNALATKTKLFTGKGLDEGQAEFAATLSAFTNQFIHELSGSAVGGQEAIRMRQQLPVLEDPYPVLMAKLKVSRENLKTIRESIKSPFGNIPQSPLLMEKRQTDPKRIMGDADYNALPSGTVFIGPDGKTRKKP